MDSLDLVTFPAHIPCTLEISTGGMLILSWDLMLTSSQSIAPLKFPQEVC